MALFNSFTPELDLFSPFRQNFFPDLEWGKGVDLDLGLPYAYAQKKGHETARNDPTH